MDRVRSIRRFGNDRFTQNRLTISLILLASILGSVSIAYATRWGPWVYSDSAAYIDTARNFISGRGFGHVTASGGFEYTSGHPPLYQLALSLFGWVGFDLLVAARWLNIILFGSTIFIIGIFFYNLSHSTVPSIIISFILMSTPELVDAFSGAMTEPFFYLFGFLGIVLTCQFLLRPSRFLLLASALATGLCFISRYPGIAFVLTAGIGIILFSRRNLREKASDFVLYIAVALAPMAGWLAWLFFNPQAGAPREINGDIAGLWRTLTPFRVQLVDVIWSWIPFSSELPAVPYQQKLVVLTTVGALILAIFAVILRRIKTDEVNSNSIQGLVILTSMNMVFILVYIIVLASAFLLSTYKPDIDRRMLGPLLLSSLIVIISIFVILAQLRRSSRALGILPWILGALFIASSLPTSLEQMKNLHQNGGGYTSLRWRSSETIRSLMNLPNNTPVITNEPAAVLFLLERPAYNLPLPTKGSKLENASRSWDELEGEVGVVFIQGGAALVLFDSLYWQLFPIFEDQTESYIEFLTQDLNIYSQSFDGSIYFYPKTNR